MITPCAGLPSSITRPVIAPDSGDMLLATTIAKKVAKRRMVFIGAPPAAK
jgi:hypothetical protein